jgi:hypothetical protein
MMALVVASQASKLLLNKSYHCLTTDHFFSVSRSNAQFARRKKAHFLSSKKAQAQHSTKLSENSGTRTSTRSN